VIGLYDHDISASAGVPQSAVCDEFDSLDQHGYGFWIEGAPVHPSLAAASVPSIGARHAELMREYRNLGVLIALVRDGADRSHSSGSVRVDRNGRTRIRYALASTDARHLQAALEAAGALHLAAGAREVRTLHTRPVVAHTRADLAPIRSRPVGANQVALFSAHVNGTCRMGTNPMTSGTTPDGERHGVRGLYVCDGSLLPTSLGVNPQETIMALATVLSRRWIER
jgi:choline dehydrogenase-like flavoprotein